MAATSVPEPAAVEPPLSDPASFSHWHTDKLRFADVDRQNHVNNSVFSVLCEGGRVAFLDGEIRPALTQGDLTVLAKLHLDYLREMHFPGDVTVGTRVLKLGRSSIQFGQGIFKDGVCTAIAVAVVVLVDPTTRRGKPLPDAIRQRLGG